MVASASRRSGRSFQPRPTSTAASFSGRGGQPAREIPLAVVQDVDGQPAGPFDRVLRGGTAMQRDGEHRRVERQGGDRARGHAVVGPFEVGRDDGDAAREVPDDVAEVVWRHEVLRGGRHALESRAPYATATQVGEA